MPGLIAGILAALSVMGGAAQASLQTGDEAREGFGIHWVDVPAEQAKDPRSNRFLVDHVPPGSTFSRRVGLVNHGRDPVDLRIYPVPAEVDDGQLSVREGVRTELTEWISVEPRQVQVPGGAEVTVTTRFDVPENASEGEHLGVIFAEATTAEGRLEVHSRVGLRVYLSVGDGGAPAANFSILDITALRTEDNAPALIVRVENTGGRVLDIDGQIELLDGPGGLSAGPYVASEPTTLDVQETGVVGFVLSDQLPAGPWRARTVLRSGLLQRAAEATIVFPDAAGGSSEPADAREVPLHRDWGFVVPLASGLLILMALLLFLFWRSWRRGDVEEAEKDPREQRENLLSRK